MFKWSVVPSESRFANAKKKSQETNVLRFNVGKMKSNSICNFFLSISISTLISPSIFICKFTSIFISVSISIYFSLAKSIRPYLSN